MRKFVIPPSLLFIMYIFLFCINISFAKEVTTTRDISEDELRATYNSLKQEEKDSINSMSEKDRLDYLKTMVLYKRSLNAPSTEVNSSSINNKINNNIEKYEPNPLLKKAFEAYNDANTPRKNVIDIFEKYIESNPDSPFLAEVYFRIGALYSIHKRDNLGEQKEEELQKEYYKKAHDLYRDKFSYLNNVAWASLVNMASSNLEERKQYYNWLQKLKTEIKPDDIYPIREIEQTFNGRSPELSLEEKTSMLKGMKRNLTNYIGTAEKNILWRTRSDYKGLSEISSSYPDTELGRNAEKLLTEFDDYYLDLLNSDIPIDSGLNQNKNLLEAEIVSESPADNIINLQKNSDVIEKENIPSAILLKHSESNLIRNLTIGTISIGILIAGFLLIVRKTKKMHNYIH